MNKTEKTIKKSVTGPNEMIGGEIIFPSPECDAPFEPESWVYAVTVNHWHRITPEAATSREEYADNIKALREDLEYVNREIQKLYSEDPDGRRHYNGDIS